MFIIIFKYTFYFPFFLINMNTGIVTLKITVKSQITHPLPQHVYVRETLFTDDVVKVTDYEK